MKMIMQTPILNFEGVSLFAYSIAIILTFENMGLPIAKITCPPSQRLRGTRNFRTKQSAHPDRVL